MKYYKVIHKATGTLMCYVSCDLNDDVDDVCKLLKSDEYTSEKITKEEFEREEERMMESE